MIGWRTSACDAHRTSLLALVDRGERTASTSAALDHLERCPSCRGEVTEFALAVRVLRNMGRELAHVEPPENGWSVLRARLARPSRPLVMSPIAGMALGMALVAMIVGPPGISSGGLGPVLGEARDPDPWVLEERFVTAGRSGPLAERIMVRLEGGPISTYPDGIQPQQKEVTTARVSGRPVTPS